LRIADRGIALVYAAGASATSQLSDTSVSVPLFNNRIRIDPFYLHSIAGNQPYSIPVLFAIFPQLLIVSPRSNVVTPYAAAMSRKMKTIGDTATADMIVAPHKD
jgi:hypothetical protein